MGIAGTVSAANIQYDQNVTNNVIFGSGNSNGAYTTDRENGVELGLRGKLRYNASGQPENTYNSNGDGTYSFVAGVAPTQASPTGVWSFEWSINSNYLGTSGGYDLNDLDYVLGLDSNPTQGTTFFAFDPINDLNPAGDGHWDHSIGNNGTANGAGVEAGDLTTYNSLIASNNLAQNSWKAHWYIPGFNPTLDGTYDIFLNAYAKGTDTLLASSSIQIIVGAGGAPVVPLPAAAPLGLLGMGMVSFLRRRKRLAA